MPEAPGILDCLNNLTKRNSAHEKLMVGFSIVLFVLGIVLIIVALSKGGVEQATVALGGTIVEVLILLPLNKIQSLRKENIVIGMLASIIDRFQDKVDSESLHKLIEDLLEYIVKK